MNFSNCDLGALSSNDGHHEEFSSHNIQTSDGALPLGLDVVFRTVRRMAAHPSYYPDGVLPEDDIAVFHFDRVKDRVSGALYDFKRVTLVMPPSQGGVKYFYIVLEVMPRPEGLSDGPLEAFRLAGVSFPMGTTTPQDRWCGSISSWWEWHPN